MILIAKITNSKTQEMVLFPRWPGKIKLLTNIIQELRKTHLKEARECRVNEWSHTLSAN